MSSFETSKIVHCSPVVIRSHPFSDWLQLNFFCLAVFTVIMAANKAFLNVGTSASTQEEGKKGETANQIRLITTATLTVGRFGVPGQKESGLLDLIEVSRANGTSWSTAGLH